jgi:hypothetical protein
LPLRGASLHCVFLLCRVAGIACIHSSYLPCRAGLLCLPYCAPRRRRGGLARLGGSTNPAYIGITPPPPASSPLAFPLAASRGFSPLRLSALPCRRACSYSLIVLAVSCGLVVLALLCAPPTAGRPTQTRRLGKPALQRPPPPSSRLFAVSPSACRFAELLSTVPFCFAVP